MMDSFMRYYKKTKALAYWFYFIFFVTTLAWADSSGLSIKAAELVATDEAYVLDADFELDFNDAVEEALGKGVPLNFLIEFQLTSPQKYWFDDEIVTVSTPVTFSYHALSRQYLINRGKHQQSFISLQEAKDEFCRLRDWRVFDKSLLKKGEIYHAALRVRLDQSKLPKPLQVEALGSEEWRLVSERYRWIPVLAL